VAGEKSLQIIENSSMPLFGYYTQEHHGEICHLSLVVGKIRSAVFVAGEIKVFGKNSWR
jgi:hypothetical protein